MNKFKEIKEVVIQPLAKATFGGLSKYPKCTTVITTELGPGGLYKTGLNESEESFFENELGLPKGTLNKRSSFWSELETRMTSKKSIVDVTDPINYLKYRTWLESSKVANSASDKNATEALFVIINDEEIAKAESILIDYEMEAYEKFMQTSPEEKKDLLKLFGKKGLESASDSVVKTTLARTLKANPQAFLEIITDKKLKTKVLIEDLLSNNIIQKKGNYYVNGDDPIGNTVEEVVMYLEDLKNQSVLIALKSKLKSKKSV
jgi:hypothetical protein